MVYEKVRMIERAPLPLEDRMQILLVYGCVKPATGIFVHSYSCYDAASNTYALNQSDFTNAVKLLRRLNLTFVVGERYTHHTGHVLYSNGSKKSLPSVERIPIFISRHENLAHALAGCDDDAELGRLYGFPTTAIEAFLGKRPTFMGDLDDRSARSQFTQFVFSQDFFREEFATTTQRWDAAVRRLSPRLYRELTEMCSSRHVYKCGTLWREDGIFFE